MKRRFMTIFWTVMISLVFSGVVYAANGEEAAALSVSAILAPLAAAALGVERALEMMWGIIESIGNILKKDDQPGGDEKVEDWKSSQKYKDFKTWFSALLSLVMGVVISYQAGLLMFTLVGFENVTANVDKFVTGIVIGSGTKFTHDVIGIFSEGKKLVEHAQGLVKAKQSQANLDQ